MKKWEAKMVALNWAIQTLANCPPQFPPGTRATAQEKIAVSSKYMDIIERMRTQFKRLQERRHD